MNKIKELNKGFTIIEVVLVLAIAGMIFLMVFIALPQMRRTQRDAERRDDMMLFVEAVKKYQTNNRGVLPEGLSNSGGTVVEVTEEQWNNFRQNADEFSWLGFYRDYLDAGDNEGDGKFRDPEGDFYALRITKCNPDSNQTCINNDPSRGDDINMDYTIHVYTGGTCKDDYVISSTNPRDFAVLYRTSSSGVICYDSRN